MATLTVFSLDSPVGRLRGAATEAGLALLGFPGSDFDGPLQTLSTDRDVRVGTHPVADELRRYFAGDKAAFSTAVDLALVGPFAQRVLTELCAVPHGTLISYGELARRIGSPGGARAVGRAVGANPVPIVVPCHRVVGAGGLLGGFSGGLPTKRKLLEIEGHTVTGDTVGATSSWSRGRITTRR